MPRAFGRSVPHVVPLMGPLSQEAAQELLTLLREPRQEARAAGGRAYYEARIGGGTNPFEPGTPEAISWRAGWDYEQGQNS